MPDAATKTVVCAEHGQVRPAFVCRHLSDQLLKGQFTPIGFFEPDTQAEEPNAWCEQCDEVMAAQGGWNDASEVFAGVKLVCSGCFARARAAQRAFEGRA